MKIAKMKYRSQWIGYKLFCYSNGLAEGNIKTLEKFIEKYYN